MTKHILQVMEAERRTVMVLQGSRDLDVALAAIQRARALDAEISKVKAEADKEAAA